MATIRSPLRSILAITVPMRPRRTPSGLIRIRVRSGNYPPQDRRRQRPLEVGAECIQRLHSLPADGDRSLTTARPADEQSAGRRHPPPAPPRHPPRPPPPTPPPAPP